jgi:prepilin-type N-terminal cleavage/methylation domain-containing protein
MLKKFSTNPSISGFTLLETLITIVLIGILSAIAVPRWLVFVDIVRLNAAQDTVYLAIREAQSEAVKNKTAWQFSLRERNGIFQWSVHKAEGGQFVPDDIDRQNSRWQNLGQNIRLDLDKNLLGKHETTIAEQTSSGWWRVLFNYQGCPVYEVYNECTHTSLRTLGQINLASKNGGSARRCVYISTILGALRKGKDHSWFNESQKYCY